MGGSFDSVGLLACLLSFSSISFVCLLSHLAFVLFLFFYLGESALAFTSIGVFWVFFSVAKKDTYVFYGNRKALVPGWGAWMVGFQITRGFFFFAVLSSFPSLT